jgi:hypothetical protein
LWSRQAAVDVVSLPSAVEADGLLSGRDGVTGEVRSPVLVPRRDMTMQMHMAMVM